MRWITQWYEKEGPGIPKDAPKKAGLALFIQILAREWWELAKLNLLIVLFCLPIVTIPAAHAAAMRIGVSMVRDRNVYLLKEYWQAFRALVLPASLFGWLGLAAVALGSYAVFIYGQMAALEALYIGPLVLCLAATLFLAIALAHLLVLLADGVAPGRQLVRLALLTTLARPLPMLAALAFTASLWLAHVLFYPVSVFMPAVMNFSLGTLATPFAGLGATQFVLALRGRREADESEEPSKAGRRSFDNRENLNA